MNELKIDLINKAGISRSGFKNIDKRYIYTIKKLIFYAILEGKLQTSKYRGFVRLNSKIEKVSEIQWKELMQ